ncbi:MAG: serine hydrolase domain-containing protein [Fimbriimonadaceae bacterium]
MLLCAPVAALAIGLLSQASAQTAETPRTLLAHLVEALSSQDDAKLRTFVTAWTPPGGLVERRMRAWGDLGKQSGPFKFVGDGIQTDTEVDGFATDRAGSRLVFMLYISSSPALHITGLQVRPAYAVEGPPLEFTHWTSLEGLAGQIASAAASPAMGIAVMRDGKLTVGVSGARKLNGPDPVRSDDVWSIGSIGKSLCSSVIGALIERGKLRWDETLEQALPDLAMDPGYSKVTLEQLMRHRGGVPQDLNFTGERVTALAGDAKTPMALRERYALDILSRKPIAAPGERFAYSNAGYALLSVIAERAGGRSYEDLLHDFIFRPLHLRHSYTDTDRLPVDRPSGHIEGPKGLVPHNMTGSLEAMLAGAGGGLYMSLADLATYGAAHLNGLRGHDGFLKAATIARLHVGLPEMPNGRSYACGWSTEPVPGLQPFDGHNGSNGTMRSQLAIFPGANLVIVGIANRGGETEPAPGFIAVMAIAARYAPQK